MPETIVVDGRDHLLGRLASIVAKELLSGKKVVIVRCDQVCVSGSVSFSFCGTCLQQHNNLFSPWAWKAGDMPDVLYILLYGAYFLTAFHFTSTVSYFIITARPQQGQVRVLPQASPQHQPEPRALPLQEPCSHGLENHPRHVPPKGKIFCATD